MRLAIHRSSRFGPRLQQRYASLIVLASLRCYKAPPESSQDMPMNKAELIDAVVTAASLSKDDATRAVDAVFNSIAAALKSGDAIAIPGFGGFAVKDRAARAGRNPQTGATIQIPASRVVGFKPGKGLKDALN